MQNSPLPPEVSSSLEWELIRHRLQARLLQGLSKLDAAPAEPVRELHLELTHRCDLACVMCEHWQLEHLDPGSVKRELSFDELRAAVERASILSDISVVVVTGGEPRLRHDFHDIVTWLSRRFPKADVIALTNFWNTGHLRLGLQRLREAGVKNLKLGSSLDGVGETHDRVRGQHGAFEGLSRTVRMAREEFPEYSFGFTFTIVPENAHEVFRAYEFVTRELGSSFGAQWAVQTDGIAPLAWTDGLRAKALDGLRSVQEDLARREEALDRIRRPRPDDERVWSELLYWIYLEEYGRDPRRFGFFKRCTAGERHVMIGAEGEVFFCPVNRARTIGNARQTGLDELWRGRAAEELRAYVASCQCHCWLRCVSTPAIDRLLRLARA